MPTSLKALQLQLQNMINPSPLQQVNHPLLNEKRLTLSVKRDDLLHPDISGNKWRKLKFNLLQARQNNISHLLSFGGAYSNHIHALAAAGFYFGFKTTAIIRGEAHYATNPTLTQAQQWGMKLHFVTRQEYKLRNDPNYLHTLQKKFPDAFIIPEGGSNRHALVGVSEIANEIKLQCTIRSYHIVTATGSGGTLAGLIAGFSNNYTKKQNITGIAVLKHADYLRDSVKDLLTGIEIGKHINWSLQTQYHGGGYAKVPPLLRDFCQQFEQQTNIPIEPIYTGKMFQAIFLLIEQNYFKPGEHIIALHTGGLQGLQGLNRERLRG